MKRFTMGLWSAAVVVTLTQFAQAQPGERRGERARPHGGPNAVLQAVDADGDHEISQAEMENSAAALQQLDLNHDDKLSRDEILGQQPNEQRRRGGPGLRGQGQRERGPRGQGRGQRGEGRPARNHEDDHRGLRHDDGNQDGPPRRRSPRDAEGSAADEPSQRPPRTARRERSEAGERGPKGRGAGERPDGRVGGPPSPERLVEHAMQFDTDKDGMLSATELNEFAAAFASQMPQQRGGGGDRGRGARGGEESRPRRPE